LNKISRCKSLLVTTKLGRQVALGIRSKQFGAATAVIAVATLSIASLESADRILLHAPFGLRALRIALGPVTGWVEAARSGSICAALWSLIPATAFSLGGFALWITTRQWPWLVIAKAVWIAAGFYYAVAMWL